MTQRPYVVAVTGGIGSGKSTVCDEFARLGVPVIDADGVAREVVAAGTAGLAAVLAEFGPGVLAADGQLDRRRLRSQVFEDPARRERLEAILHPLIRSRIAELIAAVTEPYCLLAIPLLTEKGGYQTLDRVLVVDCPTKIQVKRVMARDNLTEAEVAAIMRTQASREDRLSKADDIVTNAADIEMVRSQVADLHRQYLALNRRTQAADQS